MSDPARSFHVTEAVARWLVGDEGLAELDATVAALDAGADELSVVSGLRDRTPAPDHARAVVDAAVARRRARAEHAEADRLVLTTSALEQSSHPAVADWRARRYGAAPVLDLCCGIGGDALAMAAAGCQVTAVDLDAGRLVLLEHNARTLGLDVAVACQDVLETEIPTGVEVHADPARRINGRRVKRLADHLPSVPELLDHVAPARGSGVALSPAVDLDDPGLPSDGELEFLQVGPRLVESSLWTGELRVAGAVATATLVDAGLTEHRSGPPVELEVGPVGEWLLEPAPALTRARLHGQLGGDLGAHRLSARRALLTAETEPTASPWFTTWRVEEVLPLRAKVVRRWLANAADAPLEIATHGVDADPTTWWRQLGRPDRGPNGRRLHLVRTDDGAVAIATMTVAHSGA